MTRSPACLIRLAALGALLALSATAARADCAAPVGAEAEIAAVLDQTNAVRAQRGLPALRVSPALNRAAMAHACEMVAADRFDHRGVDGSLPKARIRRAGCRSPLTAENIAMGFASGPRTMELWLASPGHLRNILLRGVDSIGIAVAAPRPGQKGGPRWAQVFARGC